MAQTITNIQQLNIVNKLDTYNYTAAATSMYKVKVDIFEQPPSGITIAIQKNGVTQVSTPAPATAQQITSLQTVMNLVATDLISVVIASASIRDTEINAIRAAINISLGSS